MCPEKEDHLATCVYIRKQTHVSELSHSLQDKRTLIKGSLLLHSFTSSLWTEPVLIGHCCMLGRLKGHFDQTLVQSESGFQALRYFFMSMSDENSLYLLCRWESSGKQTNTKVCEQTEGKGVSEGTAGLLSSASVHSVQRCSDTLSLFKYCGSRIN